MIPNRKIYNHSFLHGLGKLKFVDENGNLMGFKTPEHLEPGPIFIHYTTTPIISEEEFRPRRGIMSRYTLTTVNNNYFETFVVGTP
jgi:hypothetical protein